MPFPDGWPPRPASSVRSIRFFKAGTTTGNWSDNAYLFIDGNAANPFKPTPSFPPGSSGPGVQVSIGDRSASGVPMGTGSDPKNVLPGETQGNVKGMIWAGTIRISNDGSADLEFSYTVIDDSGATSNQVHGVVKGGEKGVIYRNRWEAGIAFRFPSGGSASAFRVEAW